MYSKQQEPKKSREKQQQQQNHEKDKIKRIQDTSSKTNRKINTDLPNAQSRSIYARHRAHHTNTFNI